MGIIRTTIQMRRGTSVDWVNTNPKLAAGEVGFEKDTGKFKIGTGVANWNDLHYFLDETHDSPGITSHGDLTDLSDDDHPQYALANGLRGSFPTNLSVIIDSSEVIVGSDTGTDATIPAATTTDAGVLTAADKTTIDGLGNASGLDVGTTAGTVAAGDAPGAAQTAAEATAAGALSAHETDTTSVHGITDTSSLVLTGDARLSDARTPTAHKASHENGGGDELALDASQITTGTVAQARLGTGSAGAGALFLADDQTWKAAGGGSGSPTRPRILSGWHTNPPISCAFDLPTSGYVFWVPMPIEYPQAFDAIGLIVQTAGAGTVADFALVDDNNGYPGTVQRSSTGLVLTAAAEKLVIGMFSSSITLGIGLVWLAVRIVDPSANCRVACVSNSGQQWGLLPYTHMNGMPPYPNAGAHTGYGTFRSATTLAAIPTTAPSGMSIQRFSPLPGLRAA